MYEDWRLKDIPKNNNGLKVLGTFLCGGGSSMGYKLAGFNHIGGVEIDPKMASMYSKNLNPKIMIVKDIRDSFDDLKNVKCDILDGSPPCTSFSMSGKREKDWGKEKKFNEGQKHQRLDDLYFSFIDLAKEIKPKVIISENVPGLVAGNAKAYVRKILDELKKIGYKTNIYKINGASCGIAQTRVRIFFVSSLKSFKLDFSKKERPVYFKDVCTGVEEGRPVQKCSWELWDKASPGEAMSKYHKKGFLFNSVKVGDYCSTITANGKYYHNKFKRFLNDEEIRKLSSFPIDYDFCGNKVQYVCGMSVPPYMTRYVSREVLNKLF